MERFWNSKHFFITIIQWRCDVISCFTNLSLNIFHPVFLYEPCHQMTMNCRHFLPNIVHKQDCADTVAYMIDPAVVPLSSSPADDSHQPDISRLLFTEYLLKEVYFMRLPGNNIIRGKCMEGGGGGQGRIQGSYIQKGGFRTGISGADPNCCRVLGIGV